MGVEYLRSVHGIIGSILVLLSSSALFVGYFVWHDGDIFFLFVMHDWPLVTMVLVFLLAVWIVNLVILMSQTLGKDMLEELGKVKVLLIHAICALLICAAAVAETFCYSRSSPTHYYLPRLVIVMVCLWLMFVGLLGQIAFVCFQ